MPIRVVSVIGPATQLILNRRDVILCIEERIAVAREGIPDLISSFVIANPSHIIGKR